MLFPQLGPSYYDEKDRPILSRMEAAYAESITILQSFWGEADTDTRFEMGDQTMWNDIYGNLPANRRRNFTFNRIRRVINMIGGHQRRNRKSIIVTPIENADSETADQFTKIIMWICQQEGVLETISEAFHGALVTGMNLLEVWMDYRSDPVSGNIRVDNSAYSTFLIDPYFRKQDLSDCNFIWKRSFLTKRAVISLMPDKEEEILGLIGNDYGAARDGKFQFTVESYQYGLKNLMAVDNFYYRDFRKQKMLVDTQTGETMEWRGNDDEALTMFLRLHPEITMIDNQIPTVNLAIVVQGKVLYHGPNPSGSDLYPFVSVFCYYTPDTPYFAWRIQGVVRNLRDSQFLYNRRRIIELDILESQINSGWKLKENSLVNPKDAYSIMGQGRPLWVKETAQMTDVERILPPDIPPSMIQLSELLAKEVMEISGVNEELLGAADDAKPGILAKLRQGAGLTTLQILFDQLDRSQKLVGNIMLDYIQTNFTPGKVQKILEGKQPSNQFYSKAFGRYSCSVEEGLNTQTQREMQFAQMLELRAAGVPIPDEQLLEAATIQNKKELIDSIKAAAQAQSQAAQQSAQLQQAQIQSQIKLNEATAQANQGMGAERLSRIRENESLAEERKAKARRDDDGALLDMVKALKEIEGLEIGHIEKLIAVANIIKQQDLMTQQSNMENSVQTMSNANAQQTTME